MEEPLHEPPNQRPQSESPHQSPHRPPPERPAPVDRERLREHLVRTHIAGLVATPRQGNLRNYRKLAAREPDYQFGLELKERTFEEVLALMAERCGVNPDPGHFYGDDTIDPDRTIDALDAMAARLAAAAAGRERILLATGHPTGLLPVYIEAGRALRARGCTVLTPAIGWSYEVSTGKGPRLRQIRYIGGVAMLSGDGSLRHTHDSAPMRAMLAELAEKPKNWPDLAIADHGWAGAAGEAGIDTVGFADSNDPALFAGASEGKIAVCVPLDDNVLPHHYGPLSSYLLSQAGLID
jgi:hypothetical protein